MFRGVCILLLLNVRLHPGIFLEAPAGNYQLQSSQCSCIYLFQTLSFVATAARCPFKDFPVLIYTYIHSNLNWDILASFHFLTLHYQVGVTPNLLGLGCIPNQVMEEQGPGIKATHHPSPKETLHGEPSEGQPISRSHLFVHVRILNSPPFELLTLFSSVWVLFIPNARALFGMEIGLMETNVPPFFLYDFFFISSGSEWTLLKRITVADILVNIPHICFWLLFSSWHTCHCAHSVKSVR